MLNGSHYTPQDARAALSFIDPGTDRDSWVRTLMAAKAAGLSADDAVTWSASAPNFKNERDVVSVWNSAKPQGGIGPGTLYRLARDSGWKPQEGREHLPPPGNPRPPAKAPQTPDTGRRVPSVAEAWASSEPATDAHPYIRSKQGRPDGLRVVCQGYRAGWLVVPVVPLGQSDPVSLQYIAPPEVAAKLKAEGKPPKQNHKDAPVAGVYIVGDLQQGGTAYLCEGIGQAWACWRATGRAAVVCFGWGRVAKVAADLRQRDASARLVLVPDVGKESSAEAIAREVAAQWVSLPEGWPQNADVGDFAQREGTEALEALLEAPQSPAQRFRLLGSADLRKLPPLAWRVRGVLPARGLAAWYGPSASGKSFLVLDMAAAIAEGRDWFGYRVKPSSVVYCALEGEAGLRVRVAAWEKSNARALPAGLRLVLQSFKLTEPQDVADLAAAVRMAGGAGAVTILDTLNRAAPEADENASADMGRILQASKELQALTDGLVLLVSHVGKDATRGLRGHSSLFAALDAAVEVARDGDRREWKVAKAKDGEDGAGHPFRLEVVDLPPDHDGEPVTSCVVRADDSAASIARVPVPQGENQRLVYEGIRGLFKDGRTGKPGAPPTRPCIELEAAVSAGAARLACPTDKRTSRARTAIAGLVSRGVLGLNEGWLWTV